MSRRLANCMLRLRRDEMRANPLYGMKRLLVGSEKRLSYLSHLPV